MSARERRLAMLIPVAVLVFVVLRYSVFTDPEPASPASSGSLEMAEQRAIRLRRIAATVAAREASMKQSALELTDRERGIIQAETAPQAQAALLEVARRVGKTEQLDVRGGDFAAPKGFGDYGLVFATITFDCHIDQLVNFLAALGRQPELVVPAEERISSGNAKEKLMTVRMVLAGVVAKKLVPVRKGLGAF